MPTKIPQPLARRVSSLETHLKLLREALIRLDGEPDLYKLLAGELRVLVASFKTNRPLLLDLMDEAEVEYKIRPDPELPFPIQLVDEEPEPTPEGFETWLPAKIWQYHRSRGKAYSLREFVRRALAVHILGTSYSYEQLLRALAEHSGTSHEDPNIDPNLLEMESIQIGGHVSHSAPLRGLTAHVLRAGALVIKAAVDAGYVPHYFTVDTGSVSYPPLRLAGDVNGPSDR
jgi:hypothetical protein